MHQPHGPQPNLAPISFFPRPPTVCCSPPGWGGGRVMVGGFARNLGRPPCPPHVASWDGNHQLTGLPGWRDDHLRSNREAASRIFFLFVRVFYLLLLLLPHACAHAAGCMAGLLQRRAFWNI